MQAHIDSASTPGLHWVKSSYSGYNNNCVEVAVLPGHWAVRDSKNPDGPALVFTAVHWAAFQAGLKAGLFGPA
jgi:hypothetical protein